MSMTALETGWLSVSETAARTGLSKPAIRVMCQRYRLRREGRSREQDPPNPEKAAAESPTPQARELACTWIAAGPSRRLYLVDKAQLESRTISLKPRVMRWPRRVRRRTIIERELARLGWRQTDLARAARMHPSTVNLIISGKTLYVQPRTRARLLEALQEQARRLDLPAIEERAIWP